VKEEKEKEEEEEKEEDDSGTEINDGVAEFDWLAGWLAAVQPVLISNRSLMQDQVVEELLLLRRWMMDDGLAAEHKTPSPRPG